MLPVMAAGPTRDQLVKVVFREVENDYRYELNGEELSELDE
jgi:hypothetical protein